MRREKIRNGKRLLAIFLTAILSLNLIVTTGPLQASTTQINSWAFEDCMKATKLGIFTGFDSFEPQATLQVAQFLKLTDNLYQAMTQKASISAQLEKAVGSLEGKSEITREQAAFVIKAMLDLVEDKLSAYTATPNSFKDSASINKLYKDAVDYLTVNDVLNGYTDNTLKPAEAINQQQAIIILNTTYEKFENNPELFMSSAYEGFRLVETKAIDELSGVMYTFQHQKSGANLVILKNQDTNKSFCIGMKTLPTNDKGIPHIIEHTVLGGSKNFQAKDPFFTIANGQSLYTFMNALTFDNFTAYPIATANVQDYNNLMYLYMDAVFNPLVLEDKNIFLREGIRKELTTKDADMSYNGIIYNEMKGYYSNDAGVLDSAVQKALFPDTPYAYEPGGLPSAIEDLTYEEFKTFYETYYHPSNAMLYLYGDVDMIDRLQFMDENYLSNYNKKAFDLSVKEQAAFKQPVTTTEKYAVSEGTDLTNKYVIDVSYVVNDYGNTLDTYGLYLMAEILNAPNSPIEAALKKEGLSTNFTVRMDANLKQNTLSFVLHDAAKGQEQKFKNVVANTLKSMAEQGVDHTSAGALLSTYELSQRMAQYSTNNGVNYGVSLMMNWVNEAAFDQYFEYGNIFDQLAQKVKENYLEELLKTYIIGNNHCATVVLEPSTTLLKDLDLASSQKLTKYQDALKAKDLDAYIKQTADFATYVATPDTAEAMGSLPFLDVSQLETTFVEPTVTEKTLEGVKLLHAQAETGEIVQLNYLFDATKVAEEKLQYLKLALSLLTKVDTVKYTEQELYNAIYSNSMGLSIGNTVLTNYQDTKAYAPKETISFVALADHVDEMNGIISEVLLNSKFDNKDQILKQVSEIKTQYEAMEPINFAMAEVQSYYSKAGAYSNKTSGMDYYAFLIDIQKQLVSNPDAVIKELKAAYALAFPKDGLTLTVVGSKSGYTSAQNNLSILTSTLPVISAASNTYKLDVTEVNEGFASSSQVQYSVLGTNFKDLGYKYSGKMEVLASLLNGYLFNVLRMQNGAYGGGISFDEGGSALLYSYRDPMLKETYATFATISNVIETTEINDYALQSYIISAYRYLTPLYDPLTSGSIAVSQKLMNKQTDKAQLVKDVLSTTSKDIKDFAPMLKQLIEKGYYCTVGNETVINENKDLFKSVKTYLGE